MIYNGFRRIALAHSLLPAVTNAARPPQAEPQRDRMPDGESTPLDVDTTAQDHPPIHM
jgi:hypothetical protein